nr:hypothetical protein [Tanacetum cinerariifolium]
DSWNGTKDVVSPSVADEIVVKEKQSSLLDTTLGSGNGIDVVVPVDSISAVSERFANTAYGFFFGKKVAYPVVANYVRNTLNKYGLVRSMFSSSTGLFSFQFSSISMNGLDAMLENGPWFIRNNPLILKKWHPDENLLKEDVSTVLVWVKLYGVPVTIFSEDGLSAIATKLDNIVVAMPKIIREGHYTCNVHVVYEWKPHRCSSCKVFGHIHEQCPKNTCASEKKIVKKPSQTSRGVPATSSGSSFMNIDNDGEFASNTPIGEKIDKIERQICKGKLRLLDNNGNPLVPLGIVESGSEVEVNSYPDNEDYDPYDDDMHENHNLSEHVQSICDDLDITFYDRKKK